MAYLASLMGTNADIVIAWVFANDPTAPTAEEVDAHFAARHPYLYEAMACRIADFPLRLDRPIWVRHDAPVSQRTEHHHRPEGLEWSSIVEATAELCEPANRIDATKMAWKLHIYHEVCSIPDSTGTGTVVVLHASHALLNGVSLEAVSTALFSADPVPVVLPGQSKVHEARIPRRTVLRSAVSIPVALARVGIGLMRHRGESLWTVDEEHPLCEPTKLNRGSGAVGGRVIRLPRRWFEGVAASPSVVMLTALGPAVSRHLESVGELAPPYMVSTMTVAVDDPDETMGVNHVHDTRIDIGSDVDSTSLRAARIAAELRSEIERGNSPQVLKLRKLLCSSPWPAVLWMTRKRPPAPDQPVSEPPVAATVLSTTINLGKKAQSLGSRRCEFAFMPHHVGGTVGLAHFLVRTSTDYSLTVTASDDAVSADQLRAYAAFLASTIEGLCRDLRGDSEHRAVGSPEDRSVRT